MKQWVVLIHQEINGDNLYSFSVNRFHYWIFYLTMKRTNKLFINALKDQQLVITQLVKNQVKIVENSYAERNESR